MIDNVLHEAELSIDLAVSKAALLGCQRVTLWCRIRPTLRGFGIAFASMITVGISEGGGLDCTRTLNVSANTPNDAKTTYHNYVLGGLDFTEFICGHFIGGTTLVRKLGLLGPPK